MVSRGVTIRVIFFPAAARNLGGDVRGGSATQRHRYGAQRSEGECTLNSMTSWLTL